MKDRHSFIDTNTLIVGRCIVVVFCQGLKVKLHYLQNNMEILQSSTKPGLSFRDLMNVCTMKFADLQTLAWAREHRPITSSLVSRFDKAEHCKYRVNRSRRSTDTL
jgi:hypothetical protein